MATNCAKQAALDVEFPVACWRDGAKHHPVTANIAVPYQQWKPTVNHQPQLDVTQLIADIRSENPPPALQNLRATIQHNIAEEI